MLQILHVLWFIIIIKAAYKAVIVGQVRLPICYLNEKIFKFDFDSSAWKNIGCSLFKLFSSIFAINDEKKGIELHMWNFPIITLKIGMHCLYLCVVFLQLNSWMVIQLVVVPSLQVVDRY